MNTINPIRKLPRFLIQCVTLGLLIAVLVFLALPSLEVPIALAEEPPGYEPGDEMVELRGKYQKTYWLGGNEYQLVAYTSSVHYKENSEDLTEAWKEIDETIVSSNRTNWDWEVNKGHWTLLIRDDTSVAMGRDGHWAGFRLDGIAYLDWGTKEYVILQTRQNITPVAANNTVRWEGIFHGINLEYRYTSDRFQEDVEVTQQARDWLAQNPPSNYGLSNQDSLLVFYSKCDWKDAYQARDKDNIPMSWDDDNEVSDGWINFLHPLKKYVVAKITPSWAGLPRGPPDEQVRVHKRFFRENDQHWLLFGSFVTKLNNLPEGTIVFDPDTFYPDEDPETSGVDGAARMNKGLGAGVDWHDLVTGAGEASGDSAAVQGMVWIYSDSVSNKWRTNRKGIYVIDTSGLPDISVITATTFSIYGYSKDDPGSWAPDANVYSSNPDTNSAVIASDYATCGSAAYCDTPVTYASWATDGYNDWSFNATGLAAISKTGVTKLSIRNANYDVADSTPAWASSKSTYMHCYNAEETGIGKDPKLVVTYIVPPTVDTLSATNIQITSANLCGNITATGGQNADKRGFVWDTETRGDPGDTAPASSNYTDNWTEQGSFGVGTFTENITGLSEGTGYFYRAFAHNSAGWSYGGEINFTTDTTESPLPGTPTSFNLTDLGGITIGAEWAAGTNTTSFLMLVDRSYYPASANCGTEEVYSGNATSANFSGYSLDTTVYYFSLWGWNSNGYSTNYAAASIGTLFSIDEDKFILEEEMEQVATSLNSLIAVGGLIPLLLFSILAFWKPNVLLFLPAAGISMMTGLYWYDAFTTSLGLSVGLLLIAYSLVCFGFAFKCLFWREPREE